MREKGALLPIGVVVQATMEVVVLLCFFCLMSMIKGQIAGVALRNMSTKAHLARVQVSPCVNWLPETVRVLQVDVPSATCV